MAAADEALAAAIKAAKGKPMYFAFIPKGTADGKLIVAKAKIPPAVIAAAKKELGGGTPVTGKCVGPASEIGDREDRRFIGQVMRGEGGGVIGMSAAISPVEACCERVHKTMGA